MNLDHHHRYITEVSQMLEHKEDTKKSTDIKSLTKIV